MMQPGDMCGGWFCYLGVIIYGRLSISQVVCRLIGCGPRPYINRRPVQLAFLEGMRIKVLISTDNYNFSIKSELGIEPEDTDLTDKGRK